MTNEEQFWARIGVPEGDDTAVLDACWPWTGALNRDGYGMVNWRGRIMLAHRVAYELIHGPLGDSEARHMCRTRACCNPFHLLPGDHRTNLADSGLVKLSDEQIAAIRRRRSAGEKSAAIAADYGVHPGHVRRLAPLTPRAGATA